MSVTLNGDVLVGWRRWRLPRRGSTARNSAVMATVTTAWSQRPVGRCHVWRVLGQRYSRTVEQRSATVFPFVRTTQTSRPTGTRNQQQITSRRLTGRTSRVTSVEWSAYSSEFVWPRTSHTSTLQAWETAMLLITGDHCPRTGAYSCRRAARSTQTRKLCCRKDDRAMRAI